MLACEDSDVKIFYHIEERDGSNVCKFQLQGTMNSGMSNCMATIAEMDLMHHWLPCIGVFRHATDV